MILAGVASGRKSFEAFAFVEKLAALSRCLLMLSGTVLTVCPGGRAGNTGSMVLTWGLIHQEAESSPNFYVKELHGTYLEYLESCIFGLILQLGIGTYAVRCSVLN